MNTESIPMGEAVSWGWIRFKENAPLLVGVQFVALVVPTFVQHFGTAMARGAFMELVINIAAFVVTATLELGLIKIALRIIDGQPVEFAHLFDIFDRVAWFALARFIMMVAVGLGLFLLVVPGVVIALRLWFIGYATIDEHPPGLDTLQRSVEVTRGFTFDLFLFALLLIAINFLGALCFGVGLLVSLPVSLLATAYVYRHLAARRVAVPARAA